MPEPEPRRDLPAPYRSPWGLLLEDLRAVLATLRLELWQLWRRNREGLLPLPALWPQALAAWFWPGVLLLALSALLTTLLVLGHTLQAPPQGPAQAPAPGPAPRTDAALERPAQDPERSLGIPPSPSLPVGHSSAEAPQPASSEPPSAQQPSPQELAGAPARSRDPALAQVSPQQPMPLLAAFASSDPQGLLREARPRPAAAELVLVLSPAWQEMAAPLRERQASAWQQQALEQGYERLLLQDTAGRQLARPALVGSGMILLTPVAPPDADRA